MTYSNVISSKGQVTVPREIRLRLGLKAGDRIEFVVEGSYTIIRPFRSAQNPFEAYEGVLAGAFPGGIREISDWVDELRLRGPSKEPQGRKYGCAKRFGVRQRSLRSCRLYC
jgi:AbrB family looped-hinge helix DNA binding protein